MANEMNPAKVVTGEVRLSYVSLFTPRPNKNGGSPKYKVTVLIPKADTATKARIDAAIRAAIQDGAPKKWGGVIPPQPAIPLYDGDGARPSDGMAYGEECKGHWVLTASTEDKPGVIDRNGSPIIDQSQIYSGAYGMVSMAFSVYNKDKKGVGCYLHNVMKTRDGEPLASTKSSAESDFQGVIGQPTPAAPAGYAPAAAPGYPAAPPQQQYYGAPAAPGYPQQYAGVPTAPPQGYQTAPPQGYPQQQQYQAPLDPVTGQPIPPGGVLGI